MTTIVVNNSVFRTFFEKQRLTGPNFIDWYRNLRIVLSVKDKLPFLEQPIPCYAFPPARQVLPRDVLNTYTAWVKASKEIAGAEQELLQTVREFHACKQEEGQSVSSYVLKMESYIDNLERLGHAMTQNLVVSLILVSLRKEYDSFVQNYNMHGMGKTVTELHVMLKLHEQTLPQKYVAPALHAIRAGRIQKNQKKKPHKAAKGIKEKEKQRWAMHLCLRHLLLLNPRILQHPRKSCEGRNLPPLGEYMSQEFLDHLKKHGIIAHRTPPYTPQHNGVSERRNRTLLDMVRSMMSQTTLPKSFWDYSFESAARILNMVPTKKDLVDLPPNGKTIGSKWLFKKKTDMDNAVHTFKDRLVAKSFTQTYEVDYEETVSPIADIRAIRILIAIAALYDYEIWRMNVKTALLNGHLSEEVYMVQPEGFVNPKFPNRVCKLKHSIDGLKQASRQWNKRFDDEIKKFGFNHNRDESCVYMKASESYVTFIILYVDDILIMRINISILQDVKSYLGRCFAMKDLGEAAYILGIKIYRDRSKRLIGLCQSAYIEKILKRYFMENSKHGTIPMQEKLKLSKSQGASVPAEKQRMQNVPYASAVGSIMYVVRCTRRDVAFAQNITSRFQHNPGELHWTTVKNIMSTKQSIFATSSTYAEYIAAFDASKEAAWIRKFISGLDVVLTIEEPINMYCDNTRAIAIAKDHGISKGARHFRAKVHYL
nr:putative retrotransposon protein [Tanacetum cinerariifolium]